jgi:phenylacetate-CoA ligase
MSQWVKNLGERLKALELGERYIRRSWLYYPEAVRTFFRLQEASLDERKAFAERRLETVLRAASKTAYGREFRGKPLHEWPLLPKERVRGREEEFLTRPKWLTSHGSTGGTAGIPLKLYRSLQSICYEQATYDYPLLKRGLNPLSIRIAILRGDNLKDPSDLEPPFWKFVANGRKLIFSSNHLCPKTVRDYYQALKEFAPDCLFAYPTSLESLCLLMRENELSLRIPLVIATSEAMRTEARVLAMQVLNAEVLHSYGAGERVAFAWSEQLEEYFMFAGYGYVELIPVSEDETSRTYEIVGTGFWNNAMPLVRYRMADLITLPKDANPEPIRWGMQSFRGVQGRQSDYLISPEGARLMGIDHFPREVDNVLRMQVIQPAPEFVRVLVIPAQGFGQQNLEQIQRNIRRKLPQSMRVQIEIVDELVRTPTGKTPYVIREFEDNHPS